MTDLSIAQRIYNERIDHSAATQQEEIKRRAADIEKELSDEALLLNDSKALEVADDILGHMDTETMMQIMRMAIVELPAGVAFMRQFVLGEIAKSRQRIAEHRATRQVEEITPEDLLP